MKLILESFSVLALLVGTLVVLPQAAWSASPDPKHFVVDVLTINGEEFVVKDEAGTQGKIYVGEDTEKYGQVRPGDRIEAWVYPNGHAKTIIIARSASVIQEDQQQGQPQVQR
jgi:hypothetical protein